MDEEAGDQNEECGFDALLLLLATKNADKNGGVGAGWVDRILMMEMVAEDLATSLATGGGGRGVQIAVGITTAGIFLDKAVELQHYFGAFDKSAKGGTKHLLEVPARFYFIMGYDTLIRFFDPKYYASSKDMEERFERFFGRSRIVVADRSMETTTTTTITTTTSNTQSQEAGSSELDRFLKS
ncbi:hypothetical protein HK102_013055, partial [Quaeritorhiza haematococci]